MLKTIYHQLRSLFKPAEANAAQAWQAASGNAKHAYWLFATPVHMVLGCDTVFMDVPVTVTQAESVELIKALNQHFSADGYHFYLQDGTWFLGLDTDPAITTVAIEKVRNQDVAGYLPTGEGAPAWMKMYTEIQMLLFSHPINQVRESQGLPAINSVWCDGLGKVQSA